MVLPEGRCTHEDARHTNDPDMQVMAYLHTQLKAYAIGGQIHDYDAINHLIHETTIAMAGHKWSAMAIGDLRTILKLAHLQQLNAPGRLLQSLKEHLRIFAALQSRDPRAVHQAMQDQLMKQREALRHLKSQANRMSVRRRLHNAT
jgi:DNA-binding GntR family transcriptional regulator